MKRTDGFIRIPKNNHTDGSDKDYTEYFPLLYKGTSGEEDPILSAPNDYVCFMLLIRHSAIIMGPQDYGVVEGRIKVDMARFQ